MPSRLLKLGDTTFPTGTALNVVSRGRTIGVAKLARADGMRQTSGYRNGIAIEVRIPVVKGPLDNTDWRTRRDTARSMLAVGPARLYAGYDDRFYRCVECQNEPEEIPDTGMNRIMTVRALLVGPDPYEYSTTENTTTWTPTSGGSQVVSTAGNAAAAPVISITVGGSGLETIAFTISNDTTGEEFTLEGDVTAGDVIVVDSILKTVKIGTTNRIDLFEGLFHSLSVGSNTITTSWTSSSIASISYAVRDRFE